MNSPDIKYENDDVCKGVSSNKRFKIKENDNNNYSELLAESSDSSTEVNVEEFDLKSVTKTQIIATKLAASGPVGVAAAAAIASTSRYPISYSFETDPAKRKRQHTRLLRKLRRTINELTTRVGQQAVVLIAIPGNENYDVFGAKPLVNVVKKIQPTVMEQLEIALDQQAQASVQVDPKLFHLPPLVIDGIPTSVEKMTQQQLRTFIPLMLKYSSGRGKPGWGRLTMIPPWWPKDVPWANVRMDSRSAEQKTRVSWTNALRQIVINCYQFHKREDLLLAFADVDNKEISIVQQKVEKDDMPIIRQRILNPDGTLTLVEVDPIKPVIKLHNRTTAYWQDVDGESSEDELAKYNPQYILTSEDGQEYSLMSHIVSEPVGIQHVFAEMADALDDTSSETTEPESMLVQVSEDDPSKPRLVEVFTLKNALFFTNANLSINNATSENAIMMTNETTSEITLKNKFF